MKTLMTAAILAAITLMAALPAKQVQITTASAQPAEKQPALDDLDQLSEPLTSDVQPLKYQDGNLLLWNVSPSCEDADLLTWQFGFTLTAKKSDKKISTTPAVLKSLNKQKFAPGTSLPSGNPTKG